MLLLSSIFFDKQPLTNDALNSSAVKSTYQQLLELIITALLTLVLQRPLFEINVAENFVQQKVFVTSTYNHSNSLA